MYKTYVYEALSGVKAGPYNDRLGPDVRVYTLMDCTLLSCVHNLYMAMEAATRIVITGSNSVYLDENRARPSHQT